MLPLPEMLSVNTDIGASHDFEPRQFVGPRGMRHSTHYKQTLSSASTTVHSAVHITNADKAQNLSFHYDNDSNVHVGCRHKVEV